MVVVAGDAKATDLDQALKTINKFLVHCKENTSEYIDGKKLAAAETALCQIEEELIKRDAENAHLENEVKNLRGTVALLKNDLEKVKKDLSDLQEVMRLDRRVMLVRQLAFATQFSLSQVFPRIFANNKRPWSITFNTLRYTVREEGNDEEKKLFKGVVDDFNSQGFATYEIDQALLDLRSLGHGTSHPTTDAEGKVVDADQMAKVITAAPIDKSLKVYAAGVLKVLEKYQMPGRSLLDSDVPAEVSFLSCSGHKLRLQTL